MKKELKTLHPNDHLDAAARMMLQHKIGGIPVVDKHNTLIGIVTNRDLRFQEDMERKIQEVMTEDNIITTTSKTGLAEAAQILQVHKIEKLPVVDNDNKLIGLITYSDITKSKDRPNACKVKGVATVDGAVAAEAVMTFGLVKSEA